MPKDKSAPKGKAKAKAKSKSKEKAKAAPKATPTIDVSCIRMSDVYNNMRKDVKRLSLGAFTSRAYDNAVRRAKRAGLSREEASAIGRIHVAKASKLYATLTST